MTSTEFDRRIEEWTRKIDRLRAIQSGQMTLRTIEVRSYKVTGYTVRKHSRMIASARKPSTTKRAR